MNIFRNENLKFTKSVKRISISSLLFVFTMTLLSLFALPKLQTQYSLKQFLPKDNALLKKDDNTRQVFQLSDSQPFIITAKLNAERETWFNKNKIESLERLTNLLKNFLEIRLSHPILFALHLQSFASVFLLDFLAMGSCYKQFYYYTQNHFSFCHKHTSSKSCAFYSLKCQKEINQHLE